MSINSKTKALLSNYFNSVIAAMTYEDPYEAAEVTWQWYDDNYLSELPSDTHADLDRLDKLGDAVIAYLDDLADEHSRNL